MPIKEVRAVAEKEEGQRQRYSATVSTPRARECERE